MLDLDDQELHITVKSLSMTYDATSKRVDRLTGRHRADALNDLELCNAALDKAKAEQMRRRRRGDPILPIGAPQ